MLSRQKIVQIYLGQAKVYLSLWIRELVHGAGEEGVEHGAAGPLRRQLAQRVDGCHAHHDAGVAAQAH